MFSSSLESHHNGPALRGARSNGWEHYVRENSAVVQQAHPNRADTGDQTHADSPSGYPNESVSMSPPRKRARVDSSRPSRSYPRKRAVTACQLCRIRKTKCSNTRPKCKFCTDANVVCVYEDPLDHSSFDPASLLMLEKLNHIIVRLDSLDGNPSAQTIPEAVSTVNFHPTPDSTLLHSSQDGYDPESADQLEPEYLRIPSSRTTSDVILSWPIFKDRYPPNFLVQELFNSGVDVDPDDESERESETSGYRQRSRGGNSLSSVCVEENVLRLVDNFLAGVHTKNPILDVVTLKKYARRVAEDGPGWDGKSCLVLLACSLGSIAKPFSDAIQNYSNSTIEDPASSLEYARHDLQVAECYYKLARKRIGLLSDTIIRSQCYFLSGVYLMYALRPLEAWQNFLQASNAYYIYLQGRMQQSKPEEHKRSRTRRLEQRLYWSCFKSECEIRSELSLPESSISNINYPDMFPSPPGEMTDIDGNDIVDMRSFSNLTSPSSSSDTLASRHYQADSIDEIQEQSWYYYLTEIALRRIGNRILNAFYKNKTIPGFGLGVAEMMTIAVDFETQLMQCQATLPEILYYNHEDLRILPTEELAFMVRGRTVDINCWLYGPFLYFAIHHSGDDPYQRLIQPFVEKAVKFCNSIIWGLSVRHRHHGTWYGIRNGITAALSLLAAAKCGHISLPDIWKESVRTQISILRYWEEETPDLSKARTVLQELFDELA